MGLDVSHGCWSGSYSAFMRWRVKLAELIGIPLMYMEGFWDGGDCFHGKLLAESMEWAKPRDGGPGCGSLYGPMLHRFCEGVLKFLPLKWEAFKPDPLHVLLNHSDCDGEIATEHCGPIADRLAELLPKLPDVDDGGHIGNWRDATQQFIGGLRLAAKRGQKVTFG